MSGIKHQLSATGAALSKAVASKAEDAFVSEVHKMVHHLLHSPLFENLLSLVIMLNFGVIVIETDTVAQGRDTPLWMDASSVLVLVMFVAELAGRIYVERKQFFSDYWNIFDFCIVSFDAGLSLLDALIGSYFPASVLRIFRLCKVARVSKIFRVFPELRLMMAGMMGAMSAIMWGAMLLTFGLLVWSILAVQFIRPLTEELTKQGVFEGCERCGRAFDTVMSATLTLSQQIVAGDSWGTVTIPIIEHYPLTAVYFIMVFLTIGMAVMNLMLAVCVDVAIRARESLKAELVQEDLLTKEERSVQLIKICHSMDADDSGELNKKELFDGYDTNVDFQKILEELEIYREDLEIVWILLDSDKSGLVSYAEFISQLLSMKSSDTQFMLAYIRYYITIIRAKMEEQMTTIQVDIAEELKSQKQFVERQMKETEMIQQDSQKLDTLLSRFSSEGFPGVMNEEKAGLMSPKPVKVLEELENNISNANASGIFRPGEIKILEEIVQELRGQRADISADLKGLAYLLRPGLPATMKALSEPRTDTSFQWPGTCGATLCGKKEVLPSDHSGLKLLAVPPQSAFAIN